MQPFSSVASSSAIQMEIASCESNDQYGLSRCQPVAFPYGSLISVWSCHTRYPATPLRSHSIRPNSGLNM